MYNIALVDDHALLRDGLVSLINSFANFNVLLEADNGKEFIKNLDSSNLPHLVLMDISMPEMDGYDTTRWLNEKYPKIKVIALSMFDDEEAIIKMLKCGAKGYLVKNTRPDELNFAMQTTIEKGYYFNDLVNNRLISKINKKTALDRLNHENMLTPKELSFLKLICTELSYNEIAGVMGVSPRTLENYRDSLSEKLQIKNRIGLILYAIKNKIVEI